MSIIKRVIAPVVASSTKSVTTPAAAKKVIAPLAKPLEVALGANLVDDNATRRAVELKAALIADGQLLPYAAIMKMAPSDSRRIAHEKRMVLMGDGEWANRDGRKMPRFFDEEAGFTTGELVVGILISCMVLTLVMVVVSTAYAVGLTMIRGF